MASENVPCSGGCGKVRGILHSDSPKQWLCYTCAQKKKLATDRAPLHRALDAVLDGARAKDAARFTVGQHVSIRGGKSFGTITAVLPYPGNKTGKLMYEVLQDGQRKSQPLEYFKESELQNT